MFTAVLSADGFRYRSRNITAVIAVVTRDLLDQTGGDKGGFLPPTGMYLKDNARQREQDISCSGIYMYKGSKDKCSLSTWGYWNFLISTVP